LKTMYINSREEYIYSRDNIFILACCVLGLTPVREGWMKISEQICQEIEGQLLGGTLLPGDTVDENELAARYKVSRTPVREAMLRLQAQGLLTSLPRGGMVVAKMDVQ